MQDIKILEVFAYHRLLVQRYDEALPVYQFLAALQPEARKWKLAQGLCLVHQRAYAGAERVIKTIGTDGLAQDESHLLSQLNQHIAHYETNEANKAKARAPHTSLGGN